MRRVKVTRYERGALAFAVLMSVAALLLALLSDRAAEERLAVSLTFGSLCVVGTVLVLRAERMKEPRK